MALTINERPVVDINPAQLTLMQELKNLKDALVANLNNEGIKDFVTCNRLLSEIQSHVRALDILETVKEGPVMPKTQLPNFGGGLASTLGENAVAKAVA